MAIVALLDPEGPIPLQVSWAMWFAHAREAELTMVLPETETARLPELVTAKVQSLIDEDERFHDVKNAPVAGVDLSADTGGEVAEDEPSTLPCHMEVADISSHKDVIAAISKASAELFVVLLQKVDATVPRVKDLGNEILPRVACSVAVVHLGEEHWPVQHLMVAASRGSHSRAAIQLAHKLACSSEGRVTGAYVEPDIGTDAQSVGRHLLDKVVHAALLEDAANVDRRIVIGSNVESGLQKACEVVEPDAVVLGMPRPGLLSPRFFALTPARLCKRTSVPVVILRQAMPLGNRVRRALEDLMLRRVPQVERSTRVELAARVQSNSAWNFDFVALISLSTVIAALGLLQDSAAVIIGAMLIAPLMTPILGVGLALAQGNVLLARLAFRSVVFGVGTSFVLAVFVGLLDRGAHDIQPTGEMWARGWPGITDLFVAVASGLAAAYAHSRPSLVAALPGVAIAAALVPPIATSGLAFAVGNFTLAYGSFLLFFTNMVAIVLAASFSLWAVGVRTQQDKGWLRHLTHGFVALLLLLTVHLAQRTRPGPVTLAPNVPKMLAAKLPGDLHLVAATAKRTGKALEITMRVAGQAPPASGLAARLQAVANDLLHEDVELHLTYEWRAIAMPKKD